MTTRRTISIFGCLWSVDVQNVEASWMILSPDYYTWSFRDETVPNGPASFGLKRRSSVNNLAPFPANRPSPVPPPTAPHYVSTSAAATARHRSRIASASASALPPFNAELPLDRLQLRACKLFHNVPSRDRLLLRGGSPPRRGRSTRPYMQRP